MQLGRAIREVRQSGRSSLSHNECRAVHCTALLRCAVLRCAAAMRCAARYAALTRALRHQLLGAAALEVAHHLCMRGKEQRQGGKREMSTVRKAAAAFLLQDRQHRRYGTCSGLPKGTSGPPSPRASGTLLALPPPPSPAPPRPAPPASPAHLVEADRADLVRGVVVHAVPAAAAQHMGLIKRKLQQACNPFWKRVRARSGKCIGHGSTRRRKGRGKAGGKCRPKPPSGCSAGRQHKFTILCGETAGHTRPGPTCPGGTPAAAQTGPCQHPLPP